jgi:hypothetical protein
VLACVIVPIKTEMCCTSVRDWTTERQKFASSGRLELSVIHESGCLLSATHRVITGAAFTVRKLSARSAERQVHAGSGLPTSENANLLRRCVNRH